MWLDVGLFVLVVLLAGAGWVARRRVEGLTGRVTRQEEEWQRLAYRVAESEDRLAGVEARPVARMVGTVVAVPAHGRAVEAEPTGVGPLSAGRLETALRGVEGRPVTEMPPFTARRVPMATLELRDRDEVTVRHTLEVEARRRLPVVEVGGVRYAAARSEGAVFVYREV